MHHGRFVALHEQRFIAVATEQVDLFLAADAGEHGRIGDLESVEMKDRKNYAVAHGIEELVGMPTRRQGARFRLTVADDAGHNQIWIVERCAVGVSK